MEPYRKLLNDVINNLREKKDFPSRECENYTENCAALLKDYADGKVVNCGHNCEYCDKFRWVIDRARHYSEKLGIPIGEIIQSWEEDRRYWYMNYYQDCNQPLIEANNVFIFENLEEMRQKCGKEFICPCCKGISTNRNITYNGITKTKTEWAEILGVRHSNFDYRIKKNLSDEEILLGTQEKTIEKNKAILKKYFNH